MRIQLLGWRLEAEMISDEATPEMANDAYLTPGHVRQDQGTGSKWKTKFGVGVLSVGLFGAIFYLAFLNTASPRGDGPELPDLEDRIPDPQPYKIIKPRTLPADKARLDDNDLVIGVTVGDKHRAYLMRAMGGSPQYHIVDDLLGELPVSVAYCDRTHCSKVFTGGKSESVLDVAFGGFKDNHLLIRANGITYFQHNLQPLRSSAAPFPFREAEFEETTWKEWRKAHPDTDVYLRPGAE
jgi:hypothetical protein